MVIEGLLQDKVAVVTGGTRGIGFAIVQKFLEQGATVVLFGSKQATADAAVQKLKTEHPDAQVSGLAPNLSDYASIERAFQQILSEHQRIDILVNNAGISARESIYDYQPEDFDTIIDLNVEAMFRCSRAVVTAMRDQGGGCIINTSSMVSLYGQSRGCGYPTSKFAVNGLTKSLARELGPDHIRVNAVAPGVTRTDMVAELPENLIAPIIATIPLGRLGEPEDIANAFLFLASDLASYITGAIISVDGATQV